MVDIISLMLESCLIAVGSFALLVGIILGCIFIEIMALCLAFLRWLAGD